ncbi:MAG: amino acid transporter [Anaplasmataceae bacterium]|nr:amino acid transporter [Anaplasmataceae bacterium]
MSGSLIVAIGAQNAFVIRQGLLRRHLLLTALLCSLIDALLIILGVLGFGQIVSSYPGLVELSKWFAIIFLGFYGAVSLKSAFKPKSLEGAEEKPFPSRKKTILLLLALSLLNPHVYLDTVILLGSIASQQPVHEQMYFALGAVSASFVWFFAITYGSRFLSPFLRKQSSWRIIDGVVALTMWGIAMTLLIGE